MSNPYWTNAVLIDKDPGAYHLDNALPGDPGRVMSRSDLVRFSRCPAKWRKGIPEKDSESKRFGMLVDLLWLTPERWQRTTVERPPEYPSEDKKGNVTMKPFNANSHWCDAWLQEQKAKGIEVLKREERLKVHAAVDAIRREAPYFSLERGWKTQVWVEAEHQDHETGLTVRCKALLDIVPDVAHPVYSKCLADLKTCRNASLRSITNEVFSFGYHVQAALHSDIYESATGEDRPDWLLVLLENEPPYQTEPSILNAEYVGLGRRFYQRALARYCQCLKANVWPGYANREMLGPWRVIRHEDWMAQQEWLDAPVKEPEEPEQESEEVIP